MDEIEFVRLGEVAEEQIIDLMSNEKVAAYMPLLAGGFDTEQCKAFLQAKQQLWDEHGYGPWAILINGEFAGWGGVQPEHGEADFGLVLHPRFWGWGRKIFKEVIAHAFNQMNLPSITILLPPSRPNTGAVARLGFVDDGQVTVDGEVFRRFRLTRTRYVGGP